MTPTRPSASRERAAVAKTRRADSAAAALPDLSQYGRLAEYNRKRHFGVTPEPAGKVVARHPGRPLQFVVQKHRAGHLHYDFRLEHRGVMLSWAIPKGPSPDPAVKRLAMETEPHPMDYNQFEGVIPEGEYGGGTVMIWDKGAWAPEADGRLGDDADVDRQLAKGDLKFVLLGEKLAGSWVLVRTRPKQWLLIKHRDEYVGHEDLTVAKPRSVVSGRSLAEIAAAAGASPRQQTQAAAADPTAPSETVGPGAGRAGERRRPAGVSAPATTKPRARRVARAASAPKADPGRSRPPRPERPRPTATA
jgi:DNA ligase D-like protein (predicted 3'-phosphoesterase)